MKSGTNASAITTLGNRMKALEQRAQDIELSLKALEGSSQKQSLATTRA